MDADGRMSAPVYEFTAQLWRWAARADEWVFVRLPADVSAEIAAVPRLRAGFGAVRVAVTVGRSRWRTSIFPEAAEGPYVLPLKRSVRHAEQLDIGDVARITVEVVER